VDSTSHPEASSGRDSTLGDVFSVDDVRNGFLSAFNAPFDDQICGVVVVGIYRYAMPEKIVNQRIQTPNSILDMDDIPGPTPRVLSEGV